VSIQPLQLTVAGIADVVDKPACGESLQLRAQVVNLRPRAADNDKRERATCLDGYEKPAHVLVRQQIADVESEWLVDPLNLGRDGWG
jgi:hypothetical protein